MTRLNKQNKKEIVRAVLKHRFENAVKAVVSEGYFLALDVYNDKYPDEEFQRMQALPDGWLETSNNIYAVFGPVSVILNFDGMPYQWGSSPWNDLYGLYRPRSTMRRVLQTKRSGKYEAHDSLTSAYDKWANNRIDLQQDYATAKAQLVAALDSTKTIAQLLKQWPEIEPFVSKFEEPPIRQLPVIQAERLNTLLGLPVSDEKVEGIEP